MTDPDLQIRPATPDDLDAVRAIEAGYYGNMDPWPERPDFLDHELAEGRMVVAERGGEIAGFAGGYEWSGVVYVADAFVHREMLGQGIGTALLERLLADSSERFTLSSSDARALPLYAKVGMHPVAELVYLRSTKEAAAALEPHANVSIVTSDAVTVAAVEAAVTGRARLQEHRFLLRAGAEPVVVISGDETIGFAQVRAVAVGSASAAYVGPVVALDDLDVVATTALRFAATRADHVHVALFESGITVQRLVVSGFEEVGRDTLVATRDDLVDLARYAPLPELG